MKIDHQIVVVGAGFSGIGLGIQLRRAGFTDFVLLDSADGVGGVWHHNVYPGVAVDIPSPTYCYSFERNPSWSRLFAPGHELKAYAEHCVDKYGLRDHLRLGTTVLDATFVECHDAWQVRTDRGTVACRFLVCAVGPLDQPKFPDIPGIDGFAGDVVHTARWDHAVPIDGRRVAVIGTGASGLQIIPELAGRASHLQVYQRTPIWVVPKPDVGIPDAMQRMFRRLPATQRALRMLTSGFAEFVMTVGVVHHTRFPFLVRGLERVCLRHLVRQVHDPELRQALTPDYAIGCKRPSFSNTYLPTFNRQDVELVTDPIVRIDPAGIVTREPDPATGGTSETLHEVQTLVLATGFKIMQLGAMPAFPVHGIGGTELGRFWDAHRYQNFEGISTPLAPNFWLMNGPYSVAGSSWFSVIESGSRHIVRCLSEARRRQATRVVVKQQAHDRYMATMRRKVTHTVFVQPSCARANSYYFDRHGDAPFVRPVSGPTLSLASRTFDLDSYEFAPAAGRPEHRKVSTSSSS